MTRTDVSACGNCGKTKPLEAFHVHRGRPNGRQPWCRVCQGRTNRAQALAFQLAGGQPRYRDLPKAVRMDLRSVAYELADAEIRFEQSAEEIGAKRSGFVYLITNPAWPGLVKIGKAANPRARLAALNTADPYRRFRVVYQQFFDQALQVESELHSRLADRRVDGEWFRMTVKGAKAALYSVWEAA